MNATIDYGDIGNFGMVVYGDYGKPKKKKKKKKKGKKKKPPNIRQKLFNKFARQYGTVAFPAWSDDRAQCVKQYLRKKAGDGCVEVMREIKQLEYRSWLKQGLQSGQFNQKEKDAARDILGRGEAGAVEENGRSEQSKAVDGGGLEETGGPPIGLLVGGAVILGGGYWWFYGRK